MALGSCVTCIKYLMFAFNFLFWLLGCTILGIGIWLRVDQNVAKYVNQSNEVNLLYTLAYILVTVGIIIMIIGFLGCCGAIRESQIMLGLFFVCLFIIFAVLLGAGIFAVVAKDSFKDLTGKMLEDSVNNYYSDKSGHSKEFMDTIQTNLECCGSYDGSQEYLVTGGIPESCADHLSTPCNEKFFKFLSGHLMIVAGVAIGIAVVLILGMIFSMVLCCASRDISA